MIDETVCGARIPVEDTLRRARDVMYATAVAHAGDEFHVVEIATLQEAVRGRIAVHVVHVAVGLHVPAESAVDGMDAVHGGGVVGGVAREGAVDGGAGRPVRLARYRVGDADRRAPIVGGMVPGEGTVRDRSSRLFRDVHPPWTTADAGPAYGQSDRKLDCL